MQVRLLQGQVSEDAQRLATCITGAVKPTGNLAHAAVLGVEMQFLQWGWSAGEALGALPDIQKSLGLGRPTYREALIILQGRGLVDVRRGPGGGLFTAAPTAEDVVRAMMMHLAIAGASAACIEEFRLLVWRMIVDSAIDRSLGSQLVPAPPFGLGLCSRPRATARQSSHAPRRSNR